MESYIEFKDVKKKYKMGEVEIHALGGDYVSILLKEGGETPAVMKAKKRA